MPPAILPSIWPSPNPIPPNPALGGFGALPIIFVCRWPPPLSSRRSFTNECRDHILASSFSSRVKAKRASSGSRPSDRRLRLPRCRPQRRLAENGSRDRRAGAGKCHHQLSHRAKVDLRDGPRIPGGDLLQNLIESGGGCGAARQSGESRGG